VLESGILPVPYQVQGYVLRAANVVDREDVQDAHYEKAGAVADGCSCA
jgi:hypothetical protein